MLIRSAYDGNRVKVGLACGKGRTKQSFKDESNINFIMAKYAKTGVLPQARQDQLGQFLDLPDQIDLHTALQFMDVGSEAFEKLPAQLRKTFNNSPVEFLEALQSADHRDMLIEFGIFNRPPAPAPAPDPNPAPPPSE